MGENTIIQNIVEIEICVYVLNSDFQAQNELTMFSNRCVWLYSLIQHGFPCDVSVI